MLQDFPNGILKMASEPIAWTPEPQTWAQQSPNALLMLLCGLLILLGLNDLFILIKPMFQGLGRWRMLLYTEHNIHLAHRRNKLALLLSPAIVLCCNAFSLLPFPLWGCALCIFIYWLLRELPFRFLKHRKVQSEAWNAAHGSFYLFVSLLFFLLILIGVPGMAFGMQEKLLRNILYGTCILVLGISFIRSGQILASQCGPFRSFLYLCSLEFLPAALLVCAVLFDI